MQIKIKKINSKALIPKYQTTGSAGFDLHSCENITILPGQVVAVNTGLAYEIPDGFELQVRSRSGLALKENLFVLNSPGTVDSDFRAEVKVILCNGANRLFSIREGDRIAQGVINKYEKVVFEETEQLSETDRGGGGFGSTNNK